MENSDILFLKSILLKILFISSGNTDTGASPIIRNQAESLKHMGVEIDSYTLVGKGICGYLKNIPLLRTYHKEGNYDLTHAHYSLVGIIASLAGIKALVVSIMGSDAYEFRWLGLTTKVFSKYFWTATIVKSNKMKKYLNLRDAIVIPNGVDIKKFKYYSEKECIGIIPHYDKPLVIFIGNPEKKEKNLALAQEALSKVTEPEHIFLTIFGVPNDVVPYYMSTASVVLMTSLWEGSPNVIKEAMACNCPIISTDVGDVSWILDGINGCFLSEHNSNILAERIQEALCFEKRTEGRTRIIELGLDSVSIARKIFDLYKKILAFK